MKDLLQELYKNFNFKERQGPGNKLYKYVPIEDVIDRMNKTFGGRWSTEILTKEIIEDQIIISVRVSVTAPSDNTFYYHDGYGSHDIARYSGGSKQGKAVNLGNDFKSAMSKAIRTACSKWGVALFIDEEVPSDYSTSSSFESKPAVSHGVPMGGGFSNIPPMGNAPEQTPVSVSAVATDPTPFGPPMGVFNDSTPVSKPVSTKEHDFGPPMGFQTPATSAKTTASNINIPDNANEQAPSRAEGGSVAKITPVQKVAVETIMENKNITLAQLLEKTIGNPNLVVNIDDLNYSDAVKVIQNGNHINVE